MSRQKLKFRSIAAGVGVMALTLVGCSGSSGAADAGGGTIKLSIGAGHPTSIEYTVHAQEVFTPAIVERVAAETDYTLEIIEHYGGSVAGLEDVLEATQAGTIDIGLVGAMFDPSNMAPFNLPYELVFTPPSSALNVEAMRATLDQFPEVIEEFETKFGQKHLAIAGLGDYGITTNFAWTDPAELSGKKISGGGANLGWVTAVGATGVQGNYNVWYQSIETGVVDGAIVTISPYLAFNLNEVSKYYVETGFGAPAAMAMTMNTKKFDSLPEEVRQIIVEEALNYEKTVGETAESMATEARDSAIADGADFHILEPELRKEWAKKLEGIETTAIENIKSSPYTLDAEAFVEAYFKNAADLGYEWPMDTKF